MIIIIIIIFHYNNVADPSMFNSNDIKILKFN